MEFQRAEIKVESEKEFDELKAAINRAFGQDKVEKFLQQIQSSGIRVRNFEAVLTKGILERSGEKLAGANYQSLYNALPLSDQSQMREFYLSKLEELDPALRTKFKKLYQYY
ncbi:MAG: hypothetical protein QOD84_400 [Acidobacteriaceae bacterium]|jgi:hypothetical protein